MFISVDNDVVSSSPDANAILIVKEERRRSIVFISVDVVSSSPDANAILIVKKRKKKKKCCVHKC